MCKVVPYIGTWIETRVTGIIIAAHKSVVPYIGTWIETRSSKTYNILIYVVPYIGTWIETDPTAIVKCGIMSYLI